MISPSQGVHLVLDRSFLPGDAAIMVPRTSDGRVMFAIPWHGRTLVGTTDTPIREVCLEPIALDEEIDFILETASQYLGKPPTREDVLSVFAGIRPLVRAAEATNTAALSRDHTIHIAKSGLLTIAGGKWTTYRKMAEDCVDQAATLAGLDERPCVTKKLNIHGYHRHAEQFGDLSSYGSDAPAIQESMQIQPSLGRRLHDALPISAARWSGPCAMRWRGRWRTSSPAAPGPCCSTRGRPSTWPRTWRDSWPRNSIGTRPGSASRWYSSPRWLGTI